MPEKTPQDYARELMEMYRENRAELLQDTDPNNIVRQLIPPEAPRQPASPPAKTVFEDGTGGLSVNVTTLRRIYPVKGATVTVFTGAPTAPVVIETSITDESGQSGIFNLKTPLKSESQQADEGGDLPYANYNISVRSDGYVEQIAMNVPVFSGVISVQGIDLIPIAAAGGHTQPQIIQEGNDYDL